MLYRVQIVRESMAIKAVEANSKDEAEVKALIDLREDDFGFGNTYIELIDEVTEEN